MVKRGKQVKRGRTQTPSISHPMDNKPPWVRERWIKRSESWKWRMTPFVRGIISDLCGTCQFRDRCHRIPCDAKTMTEVVRRKTCSAYKSVWNPILTDKPFEWGF